MNAQKILEISNRQIFLLTDATEKFPATFIIRDKEVGGIMINTPTYTKHHIDLIPNFDINYIFLPSYLGAHDLQQWKDCTNAEIIAHENECSLINFPIDISVNQKTKLTRTIDFVPIAGRTQGSCALYLKNLPGIIFFGPILQSQENKWPRIIQKPTDYNYESRLFSALSIKDLKYQYAFTDDFHFGVSKFGPNADKAIKISIEDLFE